jgi:ubiquinone/menaquinone biosynthesis C-methylase UbiE
MSKDESTSSATRHLSYEELRAQVANGYDQVAEPYLAWSSPRPTTFRMKHLQELIATLPSTSRILELGCGAGIPTVQLLSESEKVFEVIGVDISFAQIELGKKHVPKATFIQGDMLTIDFEEESFDAVLAFYSIFHLPKEEQGMMIRRIVGWLKKGGKLLVNFGTDEGDKVREGWFKPEVSMFSSGLGVEGTREMFRKDGKGLKILEDVLDIETVGRFEETFHWILAEKEDL